MGQEPFDSAQDRQAPAQQRILGNAADWPINRFPEAVLPPNAATVYHLRDAFGYDSLYLARYRDFAAAIEHGDPSPPLNGNLLLARLGAVYGLDMMSLAGVETVLSPVHVRGLKMERAGAYYTYSNPYARPRAWVAGSAVFVPTHAEAVAALAALGPMQDTVLVTGPDDLAEGSNSRSLGGALAETLRPRSGQASAPYWSSTPGGAPPGADTRRLMPGQEQAPAQRTTPQAVSLRDISPNAVEVMVEGGEGGYLFLADAYAPGWRAWSAGRELPIRPANVAFRVVALPENAARVVFRYEPAGFRVGLFVALVTLACVAAAGGGMASAASALKRPKQQGRPE
jgi:hypothetical protein